MKIIAKTANRSASQGVKFSPSSSSIAVIVIGLRRDRLRWWRLLHRWARRVGGMLLFLF